MIESYTQAKIGLTYEEFLSRKEQIDSNLRATIFSRINDLNINAELLIFGFVPNATSKNATSLIFKVAWDDVGQHQHFASIGAGAPAAEQVLHRRQQHDFADLPQTLYNVYEAKKLSELAPSVGPMTNMAVIEPSSGGATEHIRGVSTTTLTLLESHFQQYGPRFAPQIVLPPNELY
jgi:hypothetical protein